MLLYSLLGASDGDDGADDSGVHRRKVSKDFHFPAGDCDGIGEVIGVGTGEEEEEDNNKRLGQSWRRRKRRAVMSYGSLDVTVGDLHIVIKAFQAVRPGEDKGKPPDARSGRQRKGIGGKIK